MKIASHLTPLRERKRAALRQLLLKTRSRSHRSLTRPAAFIVAVFSEGVGDGGETCL